MLRKLFLITISLFYVQLVFAQDAKFIQPGDNLILKNVPPIPESIADEMNLYTESRSASPVDWHPLKRELIMTTRFDNTTQLHYITQPGGARKQITFFNEPVSNASFEPVKGDYFVFSRDAGGNEFRQLYRYNMSDGKSTMISDGGRSQNGGVVWNKAKTKIAFTSTRRNGADRDIYVMDPIDPSSAELVFEAKGGGWGVNSWSPDDSKIIISEYISVNESTFYIYDMNDKSKAKRGLTDKKNQVVNGGADFSKDGKYIYFITDYNNEFRQLAKMNTEGKELKFITRDIKWDVTGFDISDDGSLLTFTTNENGSSGLYILETVNDEYKKLDILPEGLIGSVSWRPGSSEIAFAFTNSRSNADVYSYDFETMKLEKWTESELGGIVAENLSLPKLISWNSFDGKEISGFMYQPSAKFTGKRPVLIMIHGGPEGQSRPSFQGSRNYFIEELGIALIYPNVRGSTGFGKNFVKLDNGKLRENSVKDIGALLDWIVQQPDLDADRIIVMGGSYGGYMTLAVSTNYPEKIRCAVDIVGISNFNTFLKNTEDYRRDLRRVEYGDERDPEMYKFLESISPTTNAHKIEKPLLIVQGGNDPRVPRTEAEQMFNKLNDTGKTVWYLEATDEGHGFRKKVNADFMLYVVVEFMKRYLVN